MYAKGGAAGILPAVADLSRPGGGCSTIRVCRGVQTLGRLLPTERVFECRISSRSAIGGCWRSVSSRCRSAAGRGRTRIHALTCCCPTRLAGEKSALKQHSVPHFRAVCSTRAQSHLELTGRGRSTLGLWSGNSATCGSSRPARLQSRDSRPG